MGGYEPVKCIHPLAGSGRVHPMVCEWHIGRKDPPCLKCHRYQTITKEREKNGGSEEKPGP